MKILDLHANDYAQFYLFFFFLVIKFLYISCVSLRISKINFFHFHFVSDFFAGKSIRVLNKLVQQGVNYIAGVN